MRFRGVEFQEILKGPSSSSFRRISRGQKSRIFKGPFGDHRRTNVEIVCIELFLKGFEEDYRTLK